MKRRRRLLALLTAVVWLASPALVPAADAPAAGPVHARELTARLGTGRAPFILDVRTPEEFRAGHVPGAVNIPLMELGRRWRELEPHRESELVVYCETGPRARFARVGLRSVGFSRLRLLDGHMRKWRAQHLPLVR